MDMSWFAYSLASMVIVAVITAFTRALPFLIFGRNNKIPTVINYLGNVLPAAIMIILVLYCLRGISSVEMSEAGKMLGTALLVVVMQWFGKNTFLSIMIGTAVYMTIVA